jgi:flavodoxin
MKAVLLVYSQTDTTLEFAQRIAERLRDDNHSADIVQLTTDVPVTMGSIRQPMNFKITNLPDVSAYDLVLAGSPVWGFSVCPVPYKALQELGDLQGKKFIPFITMGFFARGMGGTRAARQLSTLAAEKHAQVLPAGIVTKMFHDYLGMMRTEAKTIRNRLR